MRKLWPLLLIAALFMVNRSCGGQIQDAWQQISRPSGSQSVPGGPVRQVERAPSDVMQMQGALPSAGGVSPNAMRDSVVQGLQKRDQ